MTPSEGLDPSQHHISVPQLLRYYASGIALSETDHVLICLHGYGQLVKYFMRKFQSIEDRIHLIFPEGMHRFYLEGNVGRVGASWMTREDRLTDIDNQSGYLDALYDMVVEMGVHKVTVLGFSQGAATASRWVYATSRPITNLVLWSSAFPPDLPALISDEENRNVNVMQFIGKDDPYLTQGLTEINSKFQSPEGLDSELILFEGAHEIRAKELDILADRILS